MFAKEDLAHAAHRLASLASRAAGSISAVPGCPLNHIVFMERMIGNGVRSQVD
jgi:hypothetical protein